MMYSLIRMIIMAYCIFEKNYGFYFISCFVIIESILNYLKLIVQVFFFIKWKRVNEIFIDEMH